MHFVESSAGLKALGLFFAIIVQRDLDSGLVGGRGDGSIGGGTASAHARHVEGRCDYAPDSRCDRSRWFATIVDVDGAQKLSASETGRVQTNKQFARVGCCQQLGTACKTGAKISGQVVINHQPHAKATSIVMSPRPFAAWVRWSSKEQVPYLASLSSLILSTIIYSLV